MHVYIEREDKTVELEFSGSAEQLCNELDVNPQTVLILKDGALVTEDTQVDDAEEIKLVTVVSGG